MSAPSSTSARRTIGNERGERATLPRDLGELLIEFSIGVHRNAMYPPNHPSLAPVAENVIFRLAQCFLTREDLTIGVARDRLVIEGVATDPKHPVLKDLALRLHQHEIGALVFRKGVVAREIRELLEALARDPEEGALGRSEEEDRPEGKKIRVRGADFGRLQVGGGGGGDGAGRRASMLWIGLAEAAMRSDEQPSSDDLPGARTLAERIGSEGRDLAYEKVVVGYLLQLAEELRSSSGAEADKVRARVSSLVRELDDETLERMIRLGGDPTRMRRFVLDANQGLAVDAVMKILRATARASEQTISHSLTRMLTKLAMHAGEGEEALREQADSALRDHVERLIDSWQLEDPNPDAYTRLLDRVARSAPLPRPSSVDGDGAEEADAVDSVEGARRLVQMAIEVDAYGATVREAISELVERGEISFLLDVADGPPGRSDLAARIRTHLTRPRQLRRLLSGESIDDEGLRAVLARMGEAAVEPLLDALVDSESRSIRRKVFDALASIEEGVGTRVVERLEDSRWYVLRNLLALLQRLETVPEGFDPLHYLAHPDRRVRREAFPLAASEPRMRERALAMGLADDDERLVRMALTELRDLPPETLLPTLVNRVIRGERPEDLRVRGVTALEGVRSSLALETLLRIVDGGRSLLGRRKVAEPTPLVLTALRVLASTWGDHERARPFLDAARRSKNGAVRSAAASRGSEG